MDRTPRQREILEHHDCLDEVTRLEAELAALRPWAEFGRRVVNERWYLEDGVYGCCYGTRQKGHDPDCPIPALLAQLEAEKG